MNHVQKIMGERRECFSKSRMEGHMETLKSAMLVIKDLAATCIIQTWTSIKCPCAPFHSYPLSEV